MCHLPHHTFLLCPLQLGNSHSALRTPLNPSFLQEAFLTPGQSDSCNTVLQLPWAPAPSVTEIHQGWVSWLLSLCPAGHGTQTLCPRNPPACLPLFSPQLLLSQPPCLQISQGTHPTPNQVGTPQAWSGCCMQIPTPTSSS